MKSVRQKVNRVFVVIALSIALGMSGCSSQTGSENEQPPILEIKGEKVYMNELEQLGRVAMANDNIKFDSAEGQKRFKEIAPNLYNTLIDIYVLKFAAEDMDVQPDPAELEKRFNRMKNNLEKDGQYERFLTSLGIDEEGLKESVKDRMATELLSAKILEEAEVEVSEQEISDYYYQNHKAFKHPNRIRAHHIYLKAPKDMAPEKRSEVKQQAEQLLNMIGDSPEDSFVGLARRYSEDPYSSSRGGDLGFIMRQDSKRYDETFLEAAFKLEEGEVSDVVETPIGYHIIWVTDHEQSLEEAREEIKKHLIQRKKTETYAQWMEETRRDMNINRLFDPVEFEYYGENEAETEKQTASASDAAQG